MIKKIFKAVLNFILSYLPIIISLAIWILVSVFLINFVNQLFSSNQEDLVEREKILLLFLLVLSLILFISIIIYLVNIILSIIRKEFGAKMKMKIAIFFIFVALLPVIPFFQIGTKFIESSMNMWFSKNIGQALDLSSEIMKNYYQDKKEGLFDIADKLQAKIKEQNLTSMQQILNLAKEEKTVVNNITLWSKQGKVVAVYGDPLFTVEEKNLLMEYREVKLISENNGIFNIKINDFGDYLILPNRIINDQEETIGFLNLAVRLLPDFKDTTLEIDSALRNYNIAGLYKNFFRRGFTILFAAIMFPIILIILIISLFFNKEIIDPIENLSRATRRIAEGDLKFQVESRYSDEFNLLSKSFNSMINELEMSRDKLQFKEKILTWKEIGEQFAHELKNPLTPIRLQTDRILKKLNENTDLKYIQEIAEKGLTTIQKETDKMEMILNEFISLSQNQSINRIRIDLYEFFNDLAEELKSLYDQITVLVDSKKKSIMILIDPLQFRKMISNLFNNSCTQMKYQGMIRFTIGEKEIGFRKYAVIILSDQYRTSEESGKEDDFSPYLNTDNQSKLLFLIIQKIVNEHEGRFYFEQKASGTDYIIEIPVQMEDQK